MIIVEGSLMSCDETYSMAVDFQLFKICVQYLHTQLVVLTMSLYALCNMPHKMSLLYLLERMPFFYFYMHMGNDRQQDISNGQKNKEDQHLVLHNGSILCIWHESSKLRKSLQGSHHLRFHGHQLTRERSLCERIS